MGARPLGLGLTCRQPATRLLRRQNPMVTKIAVWVLITLMVVWVAILVVAVVGAVCSLVE